MASHFAIPPPDEDGVVRIHKEMGITRSEFLRLLKTAVDPASFNQSGDDVDVIGAPGKVRIRLSGDRERRIALIRLPVLDVDLELSGFSGEALRAFMTRFDRAYQRGGG